MAPLNTATDSLAFQWVDLDMSGAAPLSIDPATSHPPTQQSPEPKITPIIRMYGVTEAGHSVFAHVRGFTPYLYAPAPPGFEQRHATGLMEGLNAAIMGRGRGDERELKSPCLGVLVLKNKTSLLGFNNGGERHFMQIYLAMPSLVNKVKTLLTDGVHATGFGTIRCTTTFESNVPFVLRFMVDRKVQGANWIELPKGTYSVREPKDRLSRCQVEVDVFYYHMISHPCEGRWSRLAPLRILSFDIECMGRKGVFPEADKDPVIQIASAVSVQGQDGLIVKNVFTLGGCDRINGAHVISCDTEAKLLMGWADFVRKADPDIITGYNIQNFDVPYLLNRAAALKKQYPSVARFGEWGRLKGQLCRMKDTTFQSSAYGKRENVETTIDGRVMFDMLPYFFRNHKLSSYSLNSVSAEFLGQQKDDVHHSIISDLQRGSDEDRRRLAMYCLKDAHLPLLLMEKLSVMVNYIEMARVTGVPLGFLLTRGQQIKVYSMLLRKCKTENLLIPNLAKHGADQEGYEGATVIDPKKAYYTEPIATLDFASLYPSIMQAYNLCYSTLVHKDDLASLSADQYQTSPSGDVFVRAEVHKGVLPVILDELLAARKRAKKDMALATDPMEYAVQNGRQLALKVSQSDTATNACTPPLLAQLFKTKEYVESQYTIANGYSADAEVVYGDTDSVMVKFGTKTVAEAMPLAEKAAEEVSKIFPRPIKLEFEKVYWPYLLMNKKRYAGLLWTRPDKYDKMDTKGLETVRRDNCMLVRKVVETCLHKILIDRDVDGAIAYSKEVISQLLQDRMDISLLVITKALAKSADMEGYTAKQAHVELAMRMRRRDPGTAPNVGDRVPYVIIEKGKGTPAYERSEDPVYVLENNLPIDTGYYLTNQLAKPLTRLFEPIIENPQTLLAGAHTRTVVKKTPAARKGGIVMFATVKKNKCMACKTPMDDGEGTLCKHCAPREAEIYQQKQAELNKQEVMYARLWTQCQNCQGARYEDVICSNQDCPIFYKRKKAQIDLREAQDVINRFAW
ncbi:hypothetical protein JKP88DRAFT_270411 [Tribonema minus]|uniref:DNA polymerase n=1 Tax=Tribonema minus TaxID=303371 RepID=A0A835YQA9_9STRA|nr:hypothetical protein JKP88DRAFT_270411 [Tribonema minus]